MTYLYWIHLPNSNIKTDGYIGVTNNTERRWLEHKNKNKTSIVHKAINKYDNLIYEIIYEGTEEGCYQLEHYYRPKEKIGWNITPGGGKPPTMTIEAAAKALKTRQKNGYVMSQETKDKIGATNKIIRTGTTKTKEQIFKQDVKDKTIRYFVNKSGIEETCTTWELFHKYNLNRGHIYAVVRGERKSHKGWLLKENK